MSRLPIRVRLTLAFTLAMAVVIAIVGYSLYTRLESSLNEEIDESLEAHANAISESVWLGSGIGRVPDGVAQVYDPNGERVAGAGARVRKRIDEDTFFMGFQTLITPARLRAAADEPVRFELLHVGGVEGSVRFLAVGAVTDDLEPRVVLVGRSLEDRDELLAAFLRDVLLVGLAALVLVALLCYGVATAAFRPVESMRGEAAAITGAEPGRRLPLPSSRDEVRRLGETLNAMLQRLDDAIERERSFVADASHELRTPLAILKTELDVALRHPRTADEYEGAVRSAAEEADRLVRLAEDLLVLARSDQGRLGIRPETLAAEKLLKSVAGRFGEKVTMHRPPNGLTVFGDEVKLEQAFGNLVDNALRHGGGAARISAVAEDARVELHVRDDGPGFPPDFLPHAFERFSRSDDARSGGGAGLGLALAKAIAEAHGGSAGAVNRHVRGADVWISLPVPKRGGPGSPGSPR